jgi:DNA adenine methylase
VAIGSFNPVSPLLRWAGSKRKLLPLLIKAIPSQFARYIEPFAGSACLFFALKPERAILADLNVDLIRTYSTVRAHPVRVARTVENWDSERVDYYAVRAINPRELNPVIRAARFIFLNRFCFNGVYRTNRQGHFNVPRGRRTGRLPELSQFWRTSILLRRAQLLSMDFEATLSRVRAGDFVYLDPPYAVDERPTHGEYGYGIFTSADLPRLEEMLERIDRSRATFLLSYAYGSARGLKTSRWYSRRISVRRHVAGFASHRHMVYETMISNRPI